MATTGLFFFLTKLPTGIKNIIMASFDINDKLENDHPLLHKE